MKTVFFGATGSLVDAIYYDVRNSDIEFCDFKISQIGKNKLNHLLFLGNKGKFLPFFLKDRIYKRVLRYQFLNSKEKDVFFVFTNQCALLVCEFINFVKFLKRKYKNSKCVFYSYDLINRYSPQMFNEIKQNFDMVLTFEKSDAQKYGIINYGLIYSKVPIRNAAEESDVFFSGCDNGRFKKIVDTFTCLSDFGKRCVFFVTALLKENQEKLAEYTKHFEKKGDAYVYKDSLLYVNVSCPYGRTLQYISKTKCVLEILLDPEMSGTIRVAEATTYGKKLLTNCKGVTGLPFYMAENILVFNKPEDIDVSFLDTPYVPIEHDFSPLKMIEYAKNKLFKEEIK